MSLSPTKQNNQNQEQTFGNFTSVGVQKAKLYLHIFGPRASSLWNISLFIFKTKLKRNLLFSRISLGQVKYHCS